MEKISKKYKKWGIAAILVVAAILIIRKLRNMNKVIDITEKLANRGEYTRRSLSDVDKIVVHHSATDMGRYTPYDFARWHIDPNGRLNAPRIAYHFCIEADGSILQTNKLEAWSWHAGHSEYNRTGIGIVLNGNFMHETPTAEQLKSLKWLIKNLNQKIGRKLSIVAHKEVPGVATGCPGTNLNVDKYRGIS